VSGFVSCAKTSVRHTQQTQPSRVPIRQSRSDIPGTRGFGMLGGFIAFLKGERARFDT
jgi:hypothetical protein